MAIMTRQAYGEELPHEVVDNNWTEINTRLVNSENGYTVLSNGITAANNDIADLNAQVPLLPQFEKNDDEEITGLTDGTESFKLVTNTIVEILKSSGIPVSCALTGSDEILASFTIPANTLNENSILQITPVWSFTSSGNNKILKVKVGGATVYSKTRTTTSSEGPLIELINRGVMDSQISPYDVGYFAAGAAALQTFNIDFAQNATVVITGQRANSGDTLKLEAFKVLHFLGE